MVAAQIPRGIRHFNGKSDVMGNEPESYLGANGAGPKGMLESHVKKNYWVEVCCSHSAVPARIGCIPRPATACQPFSSSLRAQKLDTYRENRFAQWKLDSSNAFGVFVALVLIPSLLYYARRVEQEDTMSRNGKKEAFALIEARQSQLP